MVSLNINIEQKNCEMLAQTLAGVLADTYVIYAKTQNFHWNIEGMNFFSLHKLLEEQYSALADKIDELAERIRMLGRKAPGSLQAFLELTSLEESGNNMPAENMLKQLLQDHESCIRNLRQAIKQANDVRDDGTADLFINCIRFHEKAAWMLRAEVTR